MAENRPSFVTRRLCYSHIRGTKPALHPIHNIALIFTTQRHIHAHTHTHTNPEMTNSKGKPTDPELREQVKEQIKQEPNKSGGGEGQWAAWKASEAGRGFPKLDLAVADPRR